jgi:hypothetical protein
MCFTLAPLLDHLAQLRELCFHFPLHFGSELFCLTGIDELHRFLYARAFKKSRRAESGRWIIG